MKFGNIAKKIRMNYFEDYVKSLDIEMAKKELSGLYRNFEVVRDYFNMKLSEESFDNRMIRKYKDRIIDALYPDSSFQGGLDVEKVDTVISNIKRNPNYLYFIQIGLFAVEECTRIANEYGGDYGEEFYEYFENLFEDVIRCIEDQGVKSKYKKQVEEIKSTAFDGYGHQDQLNDIFEKYFE